MGILTRFIILEILRVLLPIWLTLAFLLFIIEWLGQVFTVHADTNTALALYAYKIPSHLQLVFPIAVLLACLIVLGSMNRSREIIAVQSMGIKLRAILLPVFFGVGIVAILNYWIMDSVSPWGLRRHYEIFDRDVQHVPSRFSQIRQEKIWYRNQDVLYNVRHFAVSQDELFDVTIYTFDDDFHIAQTIHADHAKWNGHSEWLLENGTISLTDKRLSVPAVEVFKKRFTRLIEDPKSLKRIEFNAETMTQEELHRAIERNHALGINTSKWEVVYQSRFSFFLISFVFVFLSFPVSMRFRRSASLGRDIVIVAAVSLIYWLFFQFGINLGNAGKVSPVVAAWAPSLIFMIVVVFFNRPQTLASHSE